MTEQENDVLCCDRCSEPIDDIGDVDYPESGEWEGSMLCQSCFDEVGYD